MSTQKIIFLFILVISLFFISQPARAGIGVGVNLGKIEIDEPLKPGGIYNLPIIGVVNTGDEEGDYELEITYHQDQPELRPSQDWFSFSPAKFHLEPGESKSVEIKLALPFTMRPGDYFSYIEAHPVAKQGPSGTTIGIAAATKTYFTVAPTNVVSAVVWRVYSLFTVYAPWSYVILVVVIGAVIIVVFRRFFNFQIGVRRKM